MFKTYEFPYLDESSRALNMYRLGADVLGFAHRKIFSAKHLALSERSACGSQCLPYSEIGGREHCMKQIIIDTTLMMYHIKNLKCL